MARLDGVIESLCPNHDGATTLLKIDTQGSEEAVLSGAGDLLGRLKGLQLELSFLPLYENERTYIDVLAGLSSTGWSTHLVLPGYFSKRLSRQLQADFILFRD